MGCRELPRGSPTVLICLIITPGITVHTIFALFESERMKVLIVEDDPELNRNIKDALHTEGIEADSVFDGLLAKKILKNTPYDCIILDINLPGMNGFELCQDFRLYNAVTPIIILTAFEELEDKVQGFKCGADDYLTKPFFMKELILRVQVWTKRKNFVVSQNTNYLLRADDILINTNTRKVTRQGINIDLTAREYHILEKLVVANGDLVPKRTLIKEIWGASMDFNTNTIEVYINFLRKKVDKPFGKDTIKTKVGFGYYLELP